MDKIEELDDIPKNKLEEIAGNYEFEGAIVSVFLNGTSAASNTVSISNSNGEIDNAPWLAVAKKELSLDVKEIKGSNNNPRIVAYHSTTSLSANDDETPWCSSFVNFCMKESGLDGTNSAEARSWENWGKELDNPIPGCVVVLDRPAGGVHAGHVGFYLIEKDNKVHLLGGNQGNKVCIVPFEKNRIIAYRWPT